MGFLKGIGALLSLAADLVGWGRKRDELKNAPDMKAAKVSQNEQDAQDKTRKAIAAHDLAAEQRSLAE